MRVSALPAAGRPRRLSYRPGEVPHLTLEPSRECNLSCTLCYALERRTVKPLETVIEELETGLRHRRLHAVTLVGGEPTLYPEICEVIRAVKRRGLACQMLTNGLKLLPTRGRALLRELVDAGLDKVAFHVDGGQPHRDVEAVRRRLFDLCEEEGLLFSLSVTVYPGREAELAAAVRRYARYRWFDGILAVLGRDPHGTAPRGATLETVHAVLERELGLHPVSYLPSHRDDDDAFWLVYSYFVRADTGRIFGVSPAVHHLERVLGRLRYGRHVFLPLFRPERATARFLALGALELLRTPSRLVELLGMLRPGARSALRGHYIAIQRPPETDPTTNDLVFCRHCPDATVRSGRLTPVCLADFVRPFDGGAPRDETHESWRRSVDAHLAGTSTNGPRG